MKSGIKKYLSINLSLTQKVKYLYNELEYKYSSSYISLIWREVSTINLKLISMTNNIIITVKHVEFWVYFI